MLPSIISRVHVQCYGIQPELPMALFPKSRRGDEPPSVNFGSANQLTRFSLRPSRVQQQGAAWEPRVWTWGRAGLAFVEKMHPSGLGSVMLTILEPGSAGKYRTFLVSCGFAILTILGTFHLVPAVDAAINGEY